MLFPKRIPALKEELIPARDRELQLPPWKSLRNLTKIWYLINPFEVTKVIYPISQRLKRSLLWFFAIRGITLRSLWHCVTMGRDKPWQINAMIKPDALCDTDRVQLELWTFCSTLGVGRVLSVWCFNCQLLLFLYILYVFLCVQPSHGDKTSNPEVLKWMNALAKGRKQLKGT